MRTWAAAGFIACAPLAACSTDRTTLPSYASTVHAAGFGDPASGDFHGALLRNERYAPMMDPNADGACGRCHLGTPAPVPGVTFGAPGAAACTDCHTKPAGVLDCDTCHGAQHEGWSVHPAHVEASPVRNAGYPCSTCHPLPPSQVIGGLHADGVVEIVFDQGLVTPEASYDATTHACAVSCHDRAGTRPRLAWSDPSPALGCNDCHSSPPANHFPGACNRCHIEANPTGTALSGGPLHMNGRVDLGDGTGKCGGCHGVGDSPWPTTAAHPAHMNPKLSAPVDCASCHPVPSQVIDPAHLDGVVHVSFSGIAVARGAQPAWDGTSCAEVACHGAMLADVPAVVPQWKDTSGAASKCGTCHPIPPTQHTPSLSCGDANCHGSEVTYDSMGVPEISFGNRAKHIDGVIEVQ